MADNTSMELVPISASNLKAVINRVPHDLKINASTREISWYTGATLNQVQLAGSGGTGTIVEGVTIKSTSVDYQVSNSGTSVPTGEWNTDVPSVPAGKYLWTRMTTTYTDGSITYAYCVGYSGTNGSGSSSSTTVGVVSIDQYYLLSKYSSGVTINTAGWSKSIKVPLTDNPYLWNYSVTNYTDGSSIQSEPCIIGVAGTKGQDGTNASTIYATCSSSSNDSTKDVYAKTNNIKIESGATLSVNFTNYNSSDASIVLYNSSGSLVKSSTPIYVPVIDTNGNTTLGQLGSASPYNWGNGQTITFVYNGAAWVMHTSAADETLRQWCYQNNRTVINGGKIAASTVLASAIVTTDLMGEQLVGTGSINFGESEDYPQIRLDRLGIRLDQSASNTADDGGSDEDTDADGGDSTSGVPTSQYGIKFKNVKTGKGYCVGFNGNGNVHVKRMYCSSIRSSRGDGKPIYIYPDIRFTKGTFSFAKSEGTNKHYYGIENHGDGYFKHVYLKPGNLETASEYGPLYTTSQGLIGYKSSSSRYKTDIKYTDFDEDINPHKLYDLKPAQFKYKPEYDDEGSYRYQKNQLGFIAEDVVDAYPIAASYMDEQVISYQDTYLIPGMMALIKEQHEEIEELKRRVAALEGSND